MLTDRDKLAYATEFQFDHWKIRYLSMAGRWAVLDDQDESFTYITKAEGFRDSLTEAFDKATELYNQWLREKYASAR